jgi:hypothetical protein
MSSSTSGGTPYAQPGQLYHRSPSSSSAPGPPPSAEEILTNLVSTIAPSKPKAQVGEAVLAYHHLSDVHNNSGNDFSQSFLYCQLTPE